MTENELLQIVINKLGDNYQVSDANVLSQIVNEKIHQASFVSNREIDTSKSDENLLLLSPEIITASIIAYEQRGVEYSKNKSELGESSTFIDVDEYLRNNIIKNGKRVVW